MAEPRRATIIETNITDPKRDPPPEPDAQPFGVIAYEIPTGDLSRLASDGGIGGRGGRRAMLEPVALVFELPIGAQVVGVRNQAPGGGTGRPWLWVIGDPAAATERKTFYALAPGHAPAWLVPPVTTVPGLIEIDAECAYVLVTGEV